LFLRVSMPVFSFSVFSLMYTATTSIYTLSLHDALPIFTVVVVEHNMDLVMNVAHRVFVMDHGEALFEGTPREVQSNPAVIAAYLDRKSTRLNSSHEWISYAVFCLKKKKQQKKNNNQTHT